MHVQARVALVAESTDVELAEFLFALLRQVVAVGYSSLPTKMEGKKKEKIILFI